MLDLSDPFIHRRCPIISYVKEKKDYNLIKEPDRIKHATGPMSSSYNLMSCVCLFLLPDIQQYNCDNCEIILAELSWQPPDIWSLPVAKKHTS